MLTNIRTVFKPYGPVLLDIESLINQIIKGNKKIKKTINETQKNTLNLILKRFQDSKIPYNLLIFNPSLLSIIENKDNINIFNKLSQEIINNHSITITNTQKVVKYINLLGSYAGLFSGMNINKYEIYIYTIEPTLMNPKLIKELEIELNKPKEIEYKYEKKEEEFNEKNRIEIKIEEFNKKYPIPISSQIYFQPTEYRYFDLQLILSKFSEKKNQNQFQARNLQEKACESQAFFKRNSNELINSSTLKLKTSQKKIIISNKKTQQITLKKSRIQYLKSFYSKYKNLPEDEKLQFLKTPTEDIYIKIYMKLLRIEIEVEKWERESLKPKPDDSKIIMVYVKGIEMYNFIKKYILEINNLFIEEIFNIEDIKERINDMKKKIDFLISSFEKCSLIGIKDEIFIKFEKLIYELFPKIQKKPEIKNIIINELDIYFQIKYCGPYLSRYSRPINESSLSYIKDNRVVFSPDEWQVKLLDLVDKYGKALVSAPTASGKTFIAYYAIERVLIDYYKNKYENNNLIKRTGKILFVAPTKSLANQISSDIYVRFATFNIKTKNNKQETIKSLQGVLTQDFFININNHVLIVTPEMLETLNLNDFDFIIIDEFHLINNNTSLERAICRIKGACLLLSATVTNEKEVFNYLNKLNNYNELSTNKYELITTNKRFAELYYYIYEENKKDAYEFHPYISLLNTLIFKLEFMNLTPPNVMSLYYAIYNVIKTFNIKKYKKQFKEISIKKFFISNILIREDIENWEKTLIDFVNNMISDSEFENIKSNLFKEIIKYCCLESEEFLNGYFNYLNPNSLNNNNLYLSSLSLKEELINISNNKIMNYKNIASLLLNMKERSLVELLPPLISEKIAPKNFPLKDSLPALVFILDNDSCISACIYTYYYLLEYNELINELIKIFENYYSFNSIKEKKVEDLKKKLLKQEKKKRDLKKEKDSWKEETLLKDERAEFERDKINEHTSFTFSLTRCSENELNNECRRLGNVFKDDLTEINNNLSSLHESVTTLPNKYIEYTDNKELNIRINQLLERINKINPLIHLDYKTINFALLDMLKYGLAVHSENLSKYYRFLVEKLFRNKSILVTFSTLTLSLGINMPCKSVIFAEDSINLCSSKVKQISGRAGRRGFDVKGNVIFIEENFSKKRIIDLISNIKCEEIRSDELNECMKIRLLDVTSIHNETLKSKVFETVECKPKEKDEKSLNNLLNMSLYNLVNNIKEINKSPLFSDFFSVKTKKIGIFTDEEESSSDSLFDTNEKFLELPLINYNINIPRNLISDLLLTNENINMQILVILITRNIINLETIGFNQLIFLIGLLLNEKTSYLIKSGEYFLNENNDIIEEILGNKIFNFLNDINSLNFNSFDNFGINFIDRKLPFVNLSFHNEIYDIFVLNKKNSNLWHSCNQTVRIFRCLKLISEKLNSKIVKTIDRMLKRVELKLKEINA